MTDLIIINANILSVGNKNPKLQAVAVKDGFIAKVGDIKNILRLKEKRTEIIDLNGKTLCPGFIDPHLHFRALAESLIDIDLNPKNNIIKIEDIKAKIRSKALKTPHGKWIRASGYNEIYLEEKRHPNKWDMDQASHDHPVKLTHRSGYAHVLNSKALKETGITRETPDTDYGIIDRDINTGEPTGILFGMGGYLNKKIPEVEEEELLCGVKSADNMLLTFGITSFHDVSSRNDYERFLWFERLKRNKTITPRVNVALGVEGFEHYSRSKFSAEVDPNELSLKGVKVVVDETTGKLSPGIKELEELVLSIHTAGWQAIIHAVEENAIKASISAIEKAVNFYKRSDHRHRIEHCSICPPFLAEKIASLGIMIVTNPAFIYYSGDRYLKTVPEDQIKYLYPLSLLIKAGICTAAASDAPIATPDPMTGIYAAATRNSETGQTVLENEKITPFEAFRMFTDIAARSCFEENFKGSISAGKAGDFAVLSSNPVSVSADEIKDIKVEMTIIGGSVVYERGG